MKGLLLVLAAASVFTLTGSSPAAPAGGKKDTAAIASSNNAFALALYSRLRQREGNLFCSPFSISTALAMTYAGARGETAAEMYRTLCLPLEQAPGGAAPAPWGQERLHAAFHELVAELNARQAEGNYELTVANALWGQRGYGFSGAFLELLRASYGAGLREVDFAADPEAARRLINAWVEEQTRRRIKDLVPPGVLSPLTRLVLTNAIYFKGKWDSPFKEAASRPGEFTLAHGGKVEVPMMHQRHRFRYAETAAFQALEMPYAGGELAMLILLPRSAEGIGELEESLDAEALSRCISRLRSREVDVTLPRFTLSSRFRLAEVLGAMGMARAFTAEADFSGIAPTDRLHIQEVVHKAFVDVNEEGTEAAAATGVVVGITSRSPRWYSAPTGPSCS